MFKYYFKQKQCGNTTISAKWLQLQLCQQGANHPFMSSHAAASRQARGTLCCTERVGVQGAKHWRGVAVTTIMSCLTEVMFYFKLMVEKNVSSTSNFKYRHFLGQ